MQDWMIGVDLGATKVALGLIDPQEQVVARRRFPTVVEEGPASVVDRIVSAIGELATLMPAGGRIAGVGTCSPGPLDHRSGVIIDPPNLGGWRNIPFRQMLAERLHLPVCLEHDAKAAALGEYYFGAGRGTSSMVYIVVGTGVGAAIILDGQIYRGTNNSAGEVGHITIDPQGEVCSCGSVGCVETFLSGPGLARAYQRALRAAEAGTPGGNSGIATLPAISGAQVAGRAEAGDPLALQAMNGAGEALGTAVASLAMILDIELYVIGSSVAKAGDLLLQPAREAVARHAFRSVADRVRIVPSALPDDGPILGCGRLMRQEMRQQA